MRGRRWSRKGDVPGARRTVLRRAWAGGAGRLSREFVTAVRPVRRMRVGAMHLLTIPFRSALAALILLAAACDPPSTKADAAPQPAPWCAVETGMPGNTGDHGQVVLHIRTISGLAVLREALTVTDPEYRSEYNDRAEAASRATAQAAHLADGTWLVALAGGGAWDECTSCLL